MNLLDLLLQRGLSPTQANAATSSALGINPGEIAGMPVGPTGAPMVAGTSMGQKIKGMSPPAKPGINEKFKEHLNSPLMQFGLNMLANSAPTTAPNSFGAALGKSGLQTMQQQQAQGMSALQKQLLESQIGLANKRASTAGKESDPFGKIDPADYTTESLARFQKSKNYGDLELSEQKSNDPAAVAEFKFFQGLDKASQDEFLNIKRGYGVRDVAGLGQVDTSGQVLVPESGVSGALAGRKAEETGAVGDVKRSQENASTLPAEIAKDQDFLDKADKFIGLLESGDLSTGRIRGLFPAFSTQEQLFEAFSGENVIEAIGSATFGALSEGERSFLTGTAPGRDKTELANIEIIKRKAEIIRKGQERAKQKLGQPSGIEALLEKY